jgi:hypothetical protein
MAPHATDVSERPDPRRLFSMPNFGFAVGTFPEKLGDVANDDVDAATASAVVPRAASPMAAPFLNRLMQKPFALCIVRSARPDLTAPGNPGKVTFEWPGRSVDAAIP